LYVFRPLASIAIPPDVAYLNSNFLKSVMKRTASPLSIGGKKRDKKSEECAAASILCLSDSKSDKNAAKSHESMVILRPGEDPDETIEWRDTTNVLLTPESGVVTDNQYSLYRLQLRILAHVRALKTEQADMRRLIKRGMAAQFDINDHKGK
jgi:hypothetical protein